MVDFTQAPPIRIITALSTSPYPDSNFPQAFQNKLDSISRVSPIIHRQTLVDISRDPQKIWQQIDLILSDKNRNVLENFKYAFGVIRANDLDAAQVLGSCNYSFCHTILTRAIDTGSLDVVKFTLDSLKPEEKAKLINLRHRNDRVGLLQTPIFNAAGGRSIDTAAIIDLLISQGANPRQCGSSDYTDILPVHHAAHWGGLAGLEAICRHCPEQVDAVAGNTAPYNKYTPLCFAVEGDDVDKARFLLEKRANANYVADEYHSVPFMARSEAMLKLLAEYGMDLNRVQHDFYDGNTILARNAYRGDYNSVRYLLKQGADQTQARIDKQPIAQYPKLSIDIAFLLGYKANERLNNPDLGLLRYIVTKDRLEQSSREGDLLRQILLHKLFDSRRKAALAELSQALTQPEAVRQLIWQPDITKLNDNDSRIDIDKARKQLQEIKVPEQPTISATDYQGIKAFVEKEFLPLYSKGDALAIHALEFTETLASYIKHD